MLPWALVVVALALAAIFTLWAPARRWLSTGGERPLVDPKQDIAIDSIDGLPGWNRYAFRNRIRPRGRRHAAPPDAIVHRRPPSDD